jgi:hypothetical protein
MGFHNIGELAAADREGRTLDGFFRKVPGLASVASWWADLSMAAGNPPAQYFASVPLTAALLKHGIPAFPQTLILGGEGQGSDPVSGLTAAILAKADKLQGAPAPAAGK